MAKAKKAFLVEVEATITVLAFDEASATKKVSGMRANGTDIVGTDKVFTYAVTPTALPESIAKPVKKAAKSALTPAQKAAQTRAANKATTT